jgi:hypothetical protein
LIRGICFSANNAKTIKFCALYAQTKERTPHPKSFCGVPRGGFFQKAPLGGAWGEAPNKKRGLVGLGVKPQIKKGLGVKPQIKKRRPEGLLFF